MREQGEMTMSEMGATLSVSEPTLYRHLARHREQLADQAAKQPA